MPNEALKEIGRRLLKNIGLGVCVAAVISAGGLYVLFEILETAENAGAWGPVAAGLLVLGTCLFVGAQAALRVRAVRWIDWLRCE